MDNGERNAEDLNKDACVQVAKDILSANTERDDSE